MERGVQYWQRSGSAEREGIVHVGVLHRFGSPVARLSVFFTLYHWGKKISVVLELDKMVLTLHKLSYPPGKFSHFDS